MARRVPGLHGFDDRGTGADGITGLLAAGDTAERLAGLIQPSKPRQP
jgi:hypothetical protein